ncbi:MAG: dihydroorotate dehydrogenase [Synergistaceae bacterium]|jgi:dihydroorotate dehydrogenase (NAD+) catalytic subunit|nr:dihydroorotate dehydrogenase [Synergistaceae bacterium]
MRGGAVDLSVDFAGIKMKNPVVLASGTCGFGRELAERFDVEKLGGLASKGLTLKARDGNSGVRIWETPSGIMNSIGLENPGVKGFIEKELDWFGSLNTARIVNLGGHCLDDYLEGVSLLNDLDFDILELNISCPNVKQGGMNFGVKTEVAREVVRRVRGVCRHRLSVKLSPNAEDIVELARACEEEGADGLSLTNTFLAMAVDIYRRRPVFENTYAGLSGPAIKPISLRMVHQVARGVSIPVMGIGGISTWQDAVEFIMAGATAVQIGTATFIKPDVALDVIEGTAAFMKEERIESLEEIRGSI